MASQAPEREPRKLPSSATAGLLMARLFLRVALAQRRTIWIGLLLAVPVGLAVWWRCTDGAGGQGFFVEMVVGVFLQFFCLGLPLYLGIAAVRDEIEDRTLVYLLARPVRRWVVLGGKVAAVGVAISAAMALDVVLVFGIAASAPGAGPGLGMLLTALGVVVLACIVYTGAFCLLGVAFRRPMIPAIIGAFGWEGVLSNMPGAFPKLTLMYYLKSLLGLGPQSSGLLALLVSTAPPASAARSLWVLFLVGGIFFAAAMIIGSRREQPV
ncbi:MAG: ABC transporter permease [Deltaproteobacteria bacterium]|nr:ABC transporter permease [Deltaproteobacteria bacterium]